MLKTTYIYNIYISLYNIIYTYTHLHLSDSTIAISVQFAGEYHTQNPVYPRHRSRLCHASRERGPWRTQQKSMGSSDRMERHLISYYIFYHIIEYSNLNRYGINMDQQVFIHQSFWNVDTFWCLRLGAGLQRDVVRNYRASPLKKLAPGPPSSHHHPHP